MPNAESVLCGLADERATGALRLGKAGAFYLTGGRVTYAESSCCPRVEDLLVAGGRISVQAVRQARQASSEERWGGDLLVDRGVLTRGELEFCVLSAVLDAAFFLLESPASRSRFRPDDRHWLGPQWYFDVAGLLREHGRRRAQLDQAWPSAELDTLPVVPLARIPAQQVMLTSLQWEVLVGADCAATPVDLARKLGRPAYSVLLAVRQLGAAGLLRRPEPAPGAPSGTSPPVPPPKAPPEAVPPTAPPEAPSEAPSGTGPGAAPAEHPSGAPADGPPGAAPEAPPGTLPRRAGGTGRARDLPEDGPAPPRPAVWIPAATGDPTDVNLLIRLRNALEALA
ncbi:hypothetical protein GCM10010466_54040 [Planomonospora alba]|uniref:Uncharacterized protein n=1 Tax=Planomonospora alba TaxID=161354 RepID=A0ABP6NRM7_9ACTN